MAPVQHPGAQRPAAGGVAEGTIALTSLENTYTVGPAEGREIVIGRNTAEVHVEIGAGDRAVSRRHVVLRFGEGRWHAQRVGRREARLGSGRRLWLDGDAVALAPGYTSLMVDGSASRVHVVEIAIAGPDGWYRASPAAVTLAEGDIELDPDERLVIAAIGQPYLRDDPYPRALSWRAAEELLSDVAPQRRLTAKSIEHKVNDLRLKLSAAGHAGLVTPESPSELLKHNLIMVLIAANAVGPADLALVEAGD